ncbi:MAG: VCBS repeat-containing protein [Reichenbachiella sp.]
MTKDDFNGTLFQKVTSDKSKLDFSNVLTESDSINYLNYPYIYMGGGVSVADFNADGNMDLYFTGNMVDNKLFIGAGDLTFKDVTNASGVSGGNSWMQGSTSCDVNGDGLMDIYVSVSGQCDECPNLLFVNNGVDERGVPIFSEQAKEYGIADTGHSTQGTFFDYDQDGDLDLYVANYPITKFNSPTFYYAQMMRNAKLKQSDHLYRNNGKGSFTDVTIESGILNFGLALSATASDYNNDGLVDIYVSNDFLSPDFMYMNNGDGTFTESVKKATKQISYFGMGADAADFNNDGLIDLLQVDMAPEDNRRIKANMSGMNPEGFEEMIRAGLHYQYMYNSLQLNMGLDDNNLPIFRNIGWLAGMSSTDWSWAPLIVDLDNDGWKDIFISNGTRRDINNNDYFKKSKDENTYFKNDGREGTELEFIENMPSEAVSNYVYKNNADLTFTNATKSWGLDEKSFSNGAAYGDFDNDGDLDLIINNIDEVATLYENNAGSSPNANYFKATLKGSPQNVNGIGSRMEIWCDGQYQLNELGITRGFQSSVEPTLFFGVGEIDIIDSLRLIWPDGKIQIQTNVETNQHLVFNYSQALDYNASDTENTTTVFSELKLDSLIAMHKENDFNDYTFQVLLPHKMSNFGPALAVGDVNGDQLEDLYVGAAFGQNGKLLLQNKDKGFTEVEFQKEGEKEFEDLDAVFTDLDNDGDLDLYVVSGGNEHKKESRFYQDRIYLNTEGVLNLTEKILPKVVGSGSCVRPFDFDGDGDLDLFIGGRHQPHNYPNPGKSYILENRLEKGLLEFVDVTDELAFGLSDIGMVTDAIWTDMNKDGEIDLFIVGEWIPLTVFEKVDGKFINKSDIYFDGNTTGWWFSINAEDFDLDGDKDFVVGNLGLNYKYQAARNATFNLYSKDFDENGKNDIVLSYHNFGEEFPVRGRQCSSQQIPAIKDAYKDYNSFSTASTKDIFGGSGLENALSFKIESFESVYIENKGDDGVKINPLPIQAQSFPINDILIDDYNEDGSLDIIVAGNLYASEIETPRADAGIGLLLYGDGKGVFSPSSMKESGIFIANDTKQLVKLNLGGKAGFAAANNNGPLQVFVKN